MDGKVSCRPLMTSAISFAAADVYAAADAFFHGAEFGFCLVDQIQDFFRPFAEEHALCGERHAVFFPQKQLLSQLIFKILDLPGEGGLSDVQARGGAGDALFSGYSEKVTEYSNFHDFTSPLHKADIGRV